MILDTGQVPITGTCQAHKQKFLELNMVVNWMISRLSMKLLVEYITLYSRYISLLHVPDLKKYTLSGR